jgi:hypothetical protein
MAPSGAAIAASEDGTAMVVVAPVTGVGEMPAADWLQRSGSTAIAKYLKGAAVSAVYPSRMGRAAALASVEYSSPAGPGTAKALCVMQGGIGTLYLIAAPKTQFARLNSGMIGMLKSFSFTGQQAAPGGGSRAAAPNVSFQKVRDPNEGAFSVDVPSGWKIEGGLVRKSTLDVRMYVFATSPDGQTVIHIGDPELGAFTTPNQMLAMAGLREGSVYSPGYGNSMVVMRYIPGPAFAQQYGSRFAQRLGASGFQIKESRNRPDLSKSDNIVSTQISATAGEADFVCNRGGRECAGSVLASTTQAAVAQSIGSLWVVSVLSAYLAPMEQAGEADRILQHMLQSFELDQNWVARQSKTTMDTSQIVHDTQEHISKIITDTYWATQKSHDRTARNFDDTIRGVVRLRDPNSGDEYEGTAGKNYYYHVPGVNHPVGTDRPIVGDVNVSELEQIR